MTAAGGQISGARQAGDAIPAEAMRAWQAMRADGSIQYEQVADVPPAPPPGWLRALQDFLERLFGPLGEAIGLSWPVLEKVLLALLAGGVALIAWRLLAPLIARWRAREAAETGEEEWAPDHADAHALLAEAEQLASAGHYDAAAHLLLRRSVAQIAAARPELLHPASTAREIAASPALPARARDAFMRIAAPVERSRFALRTLGVTDWEAARTAYAAFARVELAS